MGIVGHARYAAHLAEATSFKRFGLRWRMAREYRRERSRIEPSLHSLYLSHIIAGENEGEQTVSTIIPLKGVGHGNIASVRKEMFLSLLQNGWVVHRVNRSHVPVGRVQCLKPKGRPSHMADSRAAYRIQDGVWRQVQVLRQGVDQVCELGVR